MLLSNQALGLGCLTPESQVCPWTVVLQLIQLNGRVIGYFYLFDKIAESLRASIECVMAVIPLIS